MHLILYCSLFLSLLSLNSRAGNNVQVAWEENSWDVSFLGDRLESPELRDHTFYTGQKIEVRAPKGAFLQFANKGLLVNEANYTFTTNDGRRGTLLLGVARTWLKSLIYLKVREYRVKFTRSDGKTWTLDNLEIAKDNLLPKIFRPGDSVRVDFLDGGPGEMQVRDQKYTGDSFNVQMPPGNPSLDLKLLLKGISGKDSDAVHTPWEGANTIPLTKVEAQNLLDKLQKSGRSGCKNYINHLSSFVQGEGVTEVWATISGSVQHQDPCSVYAMGLLPGVINHEADRSEYYRTPTNNSGKNSVPAKATNTKKSVPGPTGAPAPKSKSTTKGGIGDINSSGAETDYRAQ